MKLEGKNRSGCLTNVERASQCCIFLLIIKVVCEQLGPRRGYYLEDRTKLDEDRIGTGNLLSGIFEKVSLLFGRKNVHSNIKMIFCHIVS